MALSKAQIYKAITQAALNHGSDSEPDMEVGDLQEALEAALNHIPEHSIPDLLKSLEHLNGLEEQIDEITSEL
jgi:hypothetical protein